MVITPGPELETALKESARQQGIAPEELAIKALQDRFLRPKPLFEPRDEWERALLALGTKCGVSLPNSALSSEGLYE